ncbi:PD40 domain-containing protein [bacterium]|nr:PD40 domain-containing protein [bacterium]
MKIIFILLFLITQSVFAVIVEGEKGELPIAITPFQSKTGVDVDKFGEKFMETFLFDLKLSSFFQLLDPKSFIEPNDGESETTIKFQNWKMIGAEYLVKGNFEITDGKVKLTLRVFSVVEEKAVFAKEYKGEVTSIEPFAHFIADDFYKFFTGQRSVFQTKIAFIKKVKGKKQLFIMNLDGTEKRAITSNGSINMLPSWVGTTAIVYTSYKDGAPNLYLQNIYSGQTKKLSSRDGINSGGVASPDKKTVALTLTKDGNSEIYLIAVEDGKIIKRLTNDQAIDTSPSWSPDGSKLAFVSSRNFDPHIFIMNKDGSDIKRVTFQGNYNQTPKWSPKGDRVLFTARDERNKFDIFYIDLNQENKIVRLTQDDGNNEEPSWSPDGEYIVFTSTRTGSSQIYIMDKDGNNQIRITNDKDNYYTPRWSPFE